MFPERLFKSKPEITLFNGFVTQPFEKPFILEAPHGKIACAMDHGRQGLSPSEDRVVVDTQRQSYAVIDGMGGMGNGGIAADVLGQHLQTAFTQVPGPEANSFASEIMKASALAAREMLNRNAGGACFIATRVHKKQLQFCQAGDVRMILMDRKAKQPLYAHTDDEGNEDHVFNAVTARRFFNIKHFWFELKPNRRMVIASDGLWKFFSNEEVAMRISTLPIEEAVSVLTRLHNERIKDEPSRADHRSIVIADFDRI